MNCVIWNNIAFYVYFSAIEVYIDSCEMILRLISYAIWSYIASSDFLLRIVSLYCVL